MIRQISKDEIRTRIHTRIRRKVRGTAARPRLAVFRSLLHIYAQVIDDTKGETLVAASSSEKSSGVSNIIAKLTSPSASNFSINVRPSFGFSCSMTGSSPF